MLETPVYRAEREAGLADAIRSNSRLSLASAPTLVTPASVRQDVLDRARARAHLARASLDDFDLHHMTSILVTVGWNKNDDVFDKVETWVARRTPEDKQLNYEHSDANIIGHITGNAAIDGDGAELAYDLDVYDLPDKFHLVSSGVIYKNWQTPELQKRADDLIAEMAQGKWFVSMECLFRGFDYALKSASGAVQILARNDSTAFLSKHLRCYGGTGRYGDYRVGRVLRNIVFSGKGMVRNPANPESVVLSSDPVETVTAATAKSDFCVSQLEQVYSVPTPKESSKTMNQEQLQAALDAANAELAKLKNSQTEAQIAELRAKAEAANAAAGEAKAAADKAAADLAASKAAADELAKKLETALASLAESQDEIKKLYGEKTKAERLAKAKTELKLDDTAAAEFVQSTEALSDEAFASNLSIMAKAMTAWVTNNPQSGNTNFSGPTPKAAPKATPAGTAPKATSHPAPMAGKADVSADDEGAKAATETDLDGAKPDADAALSTVAADSGVTDVQKAIAEAFGMTAEQA